MGGRGGKGISRDDKDDASREPPPSLFFNTHNENTFRSWGKRKCPQHSMEVVYQTKGFNNPGKEL